MRRPYIIQLVATVVLTISAVVGASAAGWSPLLGLDLQGGVAVTYEATGDGAGDEEALEQALDIIRQRVDALGVAEPDITRQGETIVVELPGVDDAQRALDLVGQTAELRFRPVINIFDGTDPQQRASAVAIADALNGVVPEATEEPADDAATDDTTSDDTAAEDTTADDGATDDGAAADDGADDSTTTATTEAPADGDDASTDDATADENDAEGDDATTTTTPETTTTTEFDPSTAPTIEEMVTQPEDDTLEASVIFPGGDDDGVYYLLGPAEATGDIISTANATFTGQWFVAVSFTDEGSDEFDALAARNFQRPVGIVLDGVVESAPTIQQTEFNGSAQITGNFDQDEAEDLATALRFGALPVELEPQTVQQVSATLGDDALNAGIVAGLVGLALVALFMIGYYRLLGVVAILSLVVSTGILWFLIAWLGETRGLALSLSGAVGIILSIGVAVDSNIVYYERIKEEVRRGRAIRSAADGSFSGAFSTIVKADVASLIGAAVLFFLTIGAVKGFALYLGIATLIDIVVSYFFMRPMVVLLVRRFAADKPGRLGITQLPGDVTEVAS